MAPGQAGFDGGLARQQPVECGVEFVVIDGAKAERFAEAGSRRGRRQRPGDGLGHGVEDAANQQRKDEVAAAIAIGTEDASRPILRAMPRAAATCPRGKERMPSASIHRSRQNTWHFVRPQNRQKSPSLPSCGNSSSSRMPCFAITGNGRQRQLDQNGYSNLSSTPSMLRRNPRQGRSRLPIRSRLGKHIRPVFGLQAISAGC